MAIAILLPIFLIYLRQILRECADYHERSIFLINKNDNFGCCYCYCSYYYHYISNTLLIIKETSLKFDPIVNTTL